MLTAVRTRVLDEDHLIKLITGLQRREKSRAASASQEMPALKSRVSEAEAAMEGLLASIRLAPTLEKDPLFKKDIQLATDELQLARARLEDAIVLANQTGTLGEAAIAGFRCKILELLDSPNVHRRKIYLSSIVRRVDVGESEIRIEGYVDDLRKAVESSSSGSGEESVPEVRRYERRWRRGRDSPPVKPYSSNQVARTKLNDTFSAT